MAFCQAASALKTTMRSEVDLSNNAFTGSAILVLLAVGVVLGWLARWLRQLQGERDQLRSRLSFWEGDGGDELRRYRAYLAHKRYQPGLTDEAIAKGLGMSLSTLKRAKEAAEAAGWPTS